jgi:hypothetical protein
LLRQYEELNPSLAFEARATTNETQFVVRAKPGMKPHTIGNLRFPATEAGNVGREKFRQAVEEGRTINLLDGEFEWISTVQRPTEDPAPDAATRIELRISAQIPDLRIPVRLEARGKRRTARVSTTYMKLVRVGTKQIEIRIFEGQLGGELSMVLESGDNGTMRVSLHLGRVEARFAKATLELFIALAEEGTLKITLLDSEKPLLETNVNSFPFSVEEQENSIPVLEQLAMVSERLSLDLRYPDEVDEDDFHRIDLVARGIQQGEAEDRRWRVTQTLPIPVAAAREMLQAWRGGNSVAFSIRNFFEWTYQGKELPVGPTTTDLNDVRPVQTLEEIEQAIDSAGADGTVQITAVCVNMKHTFETFAPSPPSP